MKPLNCTHSIPLSAPAPGAVTRVLDLVLDWIERGRQRRMLGRLDERLLRDLGLDRAHAAEEAEKPFWRP